ncbi:MAG: amidohydrolase [Ferruginibacter sp.]|nr:amidohydrolase [Ferruginibacter sp.]
MNKTSIMNKLLLLVLLTMTSIGFSQKKVADLLVYNARIYTVDSLFSVEEAMAVKDGKIISIGTTHKITNEFAAKTVLDAGHAFIYPGFIDAHAHFLGYGLGLQTVDLTGTKSWEEILDRLKEYAVSHPDGWLTGRGWDQNDWDKKEFPGREKLDELFPYRPVFLTRVDGHAAIANGKALAGIVPGMKLAGGEVETRDGKLTGILIDNAVDLVRSKIPLPNLKQRREAFLNAQANCFKVGLTTIDDCGLQYDEVKLVETMQKKGDLKMRLYIMLSDNTANYEALFKRGMIKTDRLNVRSFKVYADGALGSRGACLLAPYSDKSGHYGFLLSTQKHFDEVAGKIYKHGFQMCTHAIGDSGNRVMLQIYAKYLKGKNDRRWRIEHAQVINENDFDLFGNNSVIPSVQPTHATSDMYWAGDRLGPERVKGAYAYKQLLEQNGWLPLGTDFPVEDISPFKTFYAACIRKDAKGWPTEGYQTANALTRKQALMGMTIWAAKANFEEKEKGSLEPGKFADFVVLNGDLLTMNEEEILQTQVLKTFVNGGLVYEKK